jgi:hypothetical protein
VVGDERKDRAPGQSLGVGGCRVALGHAFRSQAGTQLGESAGERTRLSRSVGGVLWARVGGAGQVRALHCGGHSTDHGVSHVVVLQHGEHRRGVLRRTAVAARCPGLGRGSRQAGQRQPCRRPPPFDGQRSAHQHDRPVRRTWCHQRLASRRLRCRSAQSPLHPAACCLWLSSLASQRALSEGKSDACQAISVSS